MARILAIDYGKRRLGLAISDEAGIIASPLATIELLGEGEAIDRVVRYAQKLRVAVIVVGLPLRTDGKISEMERRVRMFTQKLRRRIGVPIVFFDERLTTRIAEKVLLEAHLSRQKRKRVRDKLAAVVLLQSYLEWHRRGRGDLRKQWV